MKSVFPYPGGKSNYANWIVEHIPEHEHYIEAFGGAAGVLVNKERSSVEVYNDINEDLVTFFRVLRNAPDELIEFLELLPYSRSEYERIATVWFDDNDRPDNEVKRAAWFYYLRHANFSGKLTKAGFSTSCRTDDNRAGRYNTNIHNLKSFAKRFAGVTIERLDYSELVDRYDSKTTVFYFDPPYLEVGDEYYGHDGLFDHAEFVRLLGEIEGRWLVSYNELPDGLSEYTVATRDTRYTMSSEGHEYKTERLVMNYDPSKITLFSQTGQSALKSFTD